MAICKNCGKEISDTAKVCRFCGTKVAGAVLKSAETVSQKGANERTCPSCGKQVPATVNVCRYCGTKLSTNDWERVVNARNETVFRENQQIDINMETQFEYVNDCVSWRLFPGQIAVRINGNDLDKFSAAKGIIVESGTIAMFFDQGEYIGILPPGKHLFKKDQAGNTRTHRPQKPGSAFSEFITGIKKGVSGFMSRLFRKNKRTTATSSASKKRTYEVSVVLIRDAEFPLLFTFNDIPTKGLRSDVGLHIVAEICDVEQFYINQLMDRKFIAYDSFSRSVEPMIRNITSRVLAGYSIDEIENNSVLYSELLTALQEEISVIYPYLDVTKLITLTASNAEMERIRKMKENLYVAEAELVQIQSEYDFKQRLQNAEYQHLLSEARSKVDFEALMDKINEDHLINEDKRAEFIMLLEAEKVIREAKSKDNVDSTLHEFAKNGIIRDDEIATLKTSIAHRSALTSLENTQELELKRIDWDIMIGKKKDEADIEHKRLYDTYSDERRMKEHEFERMERDDQFDDLRRAQALRQEREEAEHKRDMEIAESIRRHEREMQGDKFAHEENLQENQNRTKVEMGRIYQGMSAEQILAANPDITPEAAKAFAAKFNAESEHNNKEELVKMYQTSKDEIAQMYQNNQAVTAHMMEQMMQTMAAMATGQVNTKQAELDRARKDAHDEQERFAAGVNNAVKSVAGSYKITNAPESSQNNRGNNNNSKGLNICPACGAENPDDSIFCENCGERLR